MSLQPREEAVRVALSSSQPRKVVAADFGVSLNSLNRWIAQYRTVSTYEKSWD